MGLNIKRLVCVFLLVAAIAGLVMEAGAYDPGNEMKRKQKAAMKQKELEQSGYKVKKEEPEPLVDKTMKVYLDSTKLKYEPGEQAEVTVYLKNESKTTRYFKRMWAPTGAGGSMVRVYLDRKESWGSGAFRRETIEPESEDPNDALMLDPGEKKPILKIVIMNLGEGSHEIQADYVADYTVVEKFQRSWWQGRATSNSLTLKVSRQLPEKEIAKELDAVIETIHGDILALRSKYPELEKYGDGALAGTVDALKDTRGIEFSTPYPQRYDLRMYFQKTDYRPDTVAMLEQGFPFLGVTLFTHIDMGEDTRLRGSLIEAVKNRARSLNQVVRKYEGNLVVEVEPFEPSLASQFDRAQIVLLGTVTKTEVEPAEKYDYQLRKWIVSIDIEDVYKGNIKDKAVQAKCGTLNMVFNSDDVVGGRFVLLLLDKSSWQGSYTLIGTQDPQDNLIYWLGRRFE